LTRENYRRWTSEELTYLRTHFANKPLKELAETLNRTETSIQDKAYSLKLKSSRNWTEEEDEVLYEHWGKVSYKTMEKKLGRTINAIKIRAQKIGLSDPRQHTPYISVTEFARIIGREYSIVKNWYKTRGLPVIKKNVTFTQKGTYIRLEDFWVWFEQNKGALDLRKIEPNALGPEPDWVKAKRKADFYNKNKPNYIQWTEKEDEQLLTLIHEGKNYNEMSVFFNRSQGAIKRRIQDKGYPHPIRLYNHTEYTEEEAQLILKMNQEGYSFEHIAQTLGPHRSASGCRGKLERMGYRFSRGTAYLVES
jgi:hypothetical protein